MPNTWPHNLILLGYLLAVHGDTSYRAQRAIADLRSKGHQGDLLRRLFQRRRGYPELNTLLLLSRNRRYYLSNSSAVG